MNMQTGYDPGLRTRDKAVKLFNTPCKYGKKHRLRFMKGQRINYQQSNSQISPLYHWILPLYGKISIY